ncbi:MAG: SOS response-associated peptidase family protein [Erythrobacter sp.]
MCNLYKLKASPAEIGDFFDAEVSGFSANMASEVYPGYPSAVVADGKLQSMNWGFPLQRKGAKGQALKPKPVNNTRTDKLKSYFWRSSFENRRCLIPVSSFAEAEGAKGKMTRTWMASSDRNLLAMGGIWRDSDEWGRAYSMIMTEANDQIAPVHNRMPVILAPEQWSDWLGGTPHQAFDLCKPYAVQLSIDRTAEPWFKPRS